MLVNIFAFAFLLVTGLFPVKYLKGKFYRCYSLDSTIDISLIKFRADCLDYGGDWIKHDFHWDNIISSLFNLFVIATCIYLLIFYYFFSNYK